MSYTSSLFSFSSRNTKAMKQTTKLRGEKHIHVSNNKLSSTRSVTTGSEENSTDLIKLEPVDGQSDANPLEPLAIQRPRSFASPKATTNDPDTKGRQMPVFQDENDRLAFDQSLQVDLGSLVDHMFKLHVINQNINDRGVAAHGRTQATLSVYSCDTCHKVFMSLSHVRLHCLVHTDIRPFKCFKCKYVTNTRGEDNCPGLNCTTVIHVRCHSCNMSFM